MNLAALTNFTASTSTLTGGTYLAATTLEIPGDVVNNAASVVLNGEPSSLGNANTNALAPLAANLAGRSLSLQLGRGLTTAAGFANAGALAVGPGGTFTANGAYTQSPGFDDPRPRDAKGRRRRQVERGPARRGRQRQGQRRERRRGPPRGAGAAGLLAISGSYTQTAAGSLNVEVGGTTAGTQSDKLSVSGAANLGGSLNVGLLNGYVPPRVRASPF